MFNINNAIKSIATMKDIISFHDCSYDLALEVYIHLISGEMYLPYDPCHADVSRFSM